MKIHEIVLKSARELVSQKGVNEFKMSELIQFINHNRENFKESTLRTHINSRLCANAPNNHAVVYNYFERIARGRYKIIIGE